MCLGKYRGTGRRVTSDWIIYRFNRGTYTILEKYLDSVKYIESVYTVKGKIRWTFQLRDKA
jgi:hypothetical protein